MEKIENAFFELLRQKELFQIRVADLCKIAGINRSTFYANYLDVYDLADKIRDRLQDEVSGFFSRDAALKFSKNDFLKLFEHIRDHQSLYQFYFKLHYDRFDTLKLYDASHAGDRIGTRDEDEIEYHVTFFKNGLNAIVRRWLQRGCVESPEQLLEILLREYRGRFEEK